MANKKQNIQILNNLNETISVSGNIETISWPAGSVSYNIGMKQTWTKAQQIEIDIIKQDIKDLKQDVGILKQDVTVLKKDVTDLKSNFDLLFQVLARNGIK